jgi:hypothetical protein
MRKSLMAAVVALCAVMLSAGPAAADHGGRYCEHSKSPVLQDSPYCKQ